LWLLFVPKRPVFDGFSVRLTVPRSPPERHGDSAMCMRFWCENSARWGENLCDTVVANFLLLINDRYHARFTPKPGHIALSPRRSDGLFCFDYSDKNRGSDLSWLRGSTVFFISVQIKPKFPQTESLCGFQEINIAT
jgi:hypothetical protein